MVKTTRYNGAIEAFECDFNLIVDEKRTFADLDETFTNNPRLYADMNLLCELSYLLRNGKAEIVLIE